HAPHLDAASRLELEARHDRPDRLVGDLRAHSERLERRDEPPAHVFDLCGVCVLNRTRSFREEIDRRDQRPRRRRWSGPWGRGGLRLAGWRSTEHGARSGFYRLLIDVEEHPRRLGLLLLAPCSLLLLSQQRQRMPTDGQRSK